MNRIRIAIAQNDALPIDSIVNKIEQLNDMEIAGTAIGSTKIEELIAAHGFDIVLAQNNSNIVDFVFSVKKRFPEAGIIIVSNDTSPAAVDRIVAALSAGAFDFVSEINKGETKLNLLVSKIRCCSIKQYSRKALDREDATAVKQPQSQGSVISSHERGHFSGTQARKEFDAVLIGVSTGGPEALMRLLPEIPANMPAPLIIVLHMPREFTGAMAASLNKKTKIRVVEAVDGEVVVAGKAYLAQGGLHCALFRDAQNILRLKILDTPPENGCKPAVDVLFKSAASVLGKRALAVVLTGMGTDGTKGAQIAKQAGATVLVQDEQSSVVWGMPGSIVRAGLADEIIPLSAMCTRFCERIQGK